MNQRRLRACPLQELNYIFLEVVAPNETPRGSRRPPSRGQRDISFRKGAVVFQGARDSESHSRFTWRTGCAAEGRGGDKGLGGGDVEALPQPVRPDAAAAAFHLRLFQGNALFRDILLPLKPKSCVPIMCFNRSRILENCYNPIGLASEKELKGKRLVKSRSVGCRIVVLLNPV